MVVVIHISDKLTLDMFALTKCFFYVAISEHC